MDTLGLGPVMAPMAVMTRGDESEILLAGGKALSYVHRVSVKERRMQIRNDRAFSYLPHSDEDAVDAREDVDDEAGEERPEADGLRIIGPSFELPAGIPIGRPPPAKLGPSCDNLLMDPSPSRLRSNDLLLDEDNEPERVCGSYIGMHTNDG